MKAPHSVFALLFVLVLSPAAASAACEAGTVRHAGRCRPAAWFERLVTPGESLLGVTGCRSAHEEGCEGTILFETDGPDAVRAVQLRRLRRETSGPSRDGFPIDAAASWVFDLERGAVDLLLYEPDSIGDRAEAPGMHLVDEASLMLDQETRDRLRRAFDTYGLWVPRGRNVLQFELVVDSFVRTIEIYEPDTGPLGMDEIFDMSAVSFAGIIIDMFIAAFDYEDENGNDIADDFERMLRGAGCDDQARELDQLEQRDEEEQASEEETPPGPEVDDEIRIPPIPPWLDHLSASSTAWAFPAWIGYGY